MASPFDLYQAKQFEGLDPNKFNTDAYAEQQRALFADTLRDQLLGLKGSYDQELLNQSKYKEQQDNASKQLEQLNSQTDSYVSKLKEAEKAVLNAQTMVDSYNRELTKAGNNRDKTQKNLQDAQNHLNNVISNQNKHRKGYEAAASDIAKLEAALRTVNPKSNNYKTILKNIEIRKNNKDYKAFTQYNNELQDARNNINNYSRELGQLNNQISTWENKVKTEQQNNLVPRQQALQQVNDELNNHKNTISTLSKQVEDLTKLTGTSSEVAQKAVADAEAIQSKIQNYQTRSEPLKELQTKIEGDYNTIAKASNEELKKIASNNLDPVSQKNAQNLLNQRAEQLSKTFGKSVEDVRKELGVDVSLAPQQFTSQEEFNAFMGVLPPPVQEVLLQQQGNLNNKEEVAPAQPIQQPTPKVMPELQEQGRVNNLQEPAPQPQLSQVPPQPVQPQPIPQVAQQQPQVNQVQKQQQAESSGSPVVPSPQPAPQQPNVPQQAQAQQQQTGMPQPPQQPFGSIGGAVKRGLASQLQQGFQNAMKIRSTQPQQQQPKPQQPAVDPMVARRQAVAAQAMGIASKPTSVSQRDNKGSAFGQSQNVQMNKQQNTLNSGAGRRQPR